MEQVEKIVEAAPASRETFFEELYENAFPVFARFAARANASFEDARDIFHDALVIYYEKCQEEGFVIRTTDEAYVVGIAKHLWARKFRQDRHMVLLDGLEPEIVVPHDHFPSADEASLLNFLEQAGKRCLDLLRKFYFEKTSLRNIAGSLGYGSEHSAAVQKFKCIAKVRRAIEKNQCAMRTLLSEVSEIENYLRGELSPGGRLVFEARLHLDAGLAKKTFFQRVVHRLVTLYHRKQLKREVQVVHERLFNDPSRGAFREDVMKIFNP